VSGSRFRRWLDSEIAAQVAEIRQFVTIRTFLRLLGCIYAIAFISFGTQAAGLVGSHGILPYENFLRAMREEFGRTAWRYAPTVLWLRPGDAALAAVWIVGCVGAILAALGKWQRPALAVCLVLWLSICSVGQDFLGFQWDALLVETGFLAVFADARPVRIWLFRWLAFRLMFFSGVVKLASHDEAWRNLTALHYHYETQPLPNPLSWLMYQLPMVFQKFSTAFTLIVELAIPFLFFMPRKLRHAGAWITILLQALIFLTGNYTYFNLLAMLLCMWMFIEPERELRFNLVDFGLAGLIGLLSLILCLNLFSVPLPPGGSAVLHFAAPFEIVNSYGLFAVMTTERDEIVVEGSTDGKSWRAYEFRYKPGDPYRAPRIVEPFQPRLDWQMWFAALGTYQQNRWFVNFVVRLLQNEPAVTHLLAYNPFAAAPPKVIRARLYRYDFTHFGEKAWWSRQDRGLYIPPVSLK
jgi:hypothetical protein